MLWIWLGFIGFVLLMLALDLGVFHRHAHVVSVKEALGWSAVWVAMGLGFAVFVYFGYERHWLGLGLAPDPVDALVNDGASATVKYLTGYVVEKSLSVDNVFVIAMLFGFFAVPAIYQHRVLFWGILGALVMRGVMIAVGARLIAEFHWVLYVFGAFLILTGIKMWWASGKENDLESNPALKLLRRILPVSKGFDGERFFTVENGKRIATPLLMVIALVGLTDVIFAVDSIPAIFAITMDPFIVLTSNIFAILGLRAMYFLLAAVAAKFHLLSYGLAIILVFIGTKMMLIDVFKIPVAVSLGVVVAVLAATMWLSLRTAPKLPTSAAAEGAAGKE